MTDEGTNGWGEWRRHVLIQMEEHTTALKECNVRLNKVDQDIVMLKVKSSLWGAVAGAIVVVVMLAISYLKP